MRIDGASQVEDVCLHKFGSELYSKLYTEVDLHLNNSFFASKMPNEIIPSLARRWTEFTEEMRAIRLIFLYLDRSLKSLSSTDAIPLSRSLWDMGLKVSRGCSVFLF